MNHKHPKRRSHVRRRILTDNVNRSRPPLPPKGENLLNPPPVPPPRRNRKTTQVGCVLAWNLSTARESFSRHRRQSSILWILDVPQHPSVPKDRFGITRARWRSGCTANEFSRSSLCFLATVAKIGSVTKSPGHGSCLSPNPTSSLSRRVFTESDRWMLIPFRRCWLKRRSFYSKRHTEVFLKCYCPCEL